MLYRDFTVREMCESICVTKTVNELFKNGLEINDGRLAIPALEELIRRGDSDIIAKSLDQAFDKGWLTREHSFTMVVEASLFINIWDVDPFLFEYSDDFLRGAFYGGPSAWVRTQAKKFRKYYQCGKVRNAKPWAAEQIWAGETDPKCNYDQC